MQKVRVKNSRFSEQSKSYALLVGIPLSLLVLLATAVFVPRFLAHPEQDFIYSKCLSYRCSDEVLVLDGHISKQVKQTSYYDDATYPYYTHSTELFYYDVSDGVSRKISLEEADRLTLDDFEESKDGYRFEAQRSTSRFMQEPRWMLRNGIMTKPLNVSPAYKSVTFIGWVK